MIEINHTDTEATKRSMPPGWRWVQLKNDQLFSFENGTWTGEQPPFIECAVIRNTNFTNDGTLNLSNVAIIPVEQRLLPKKALLWGDIIIERSGGGPKQPVGRVAFFDLHEENHCFSNFTSRLRVLDRSAVDPRYMHLFLHFFHLSGQTQQLQNATTNIRNLMFDAYRSLYVPLPPLDEQRVIAAQLEHDMANVARLRAEARRQRDAIDALPSAYLREVLEGVEAQAWPRVRLGEVLRLRKDVIHPYNNPAGPATFVGLEHIESHTGQRIGSLEVEMSNLTGRKPQFFQGDIVYGYLRPYLNKVWVADFDGLCSVDQYVYTVNAERADTAFIAAFMRSPIYLNRAPIKTTPGQLPRIRTEEVLSVEMALPALVDQVKIVQQLNSVIAEVEQLRAAAARQRQAVDALPGALLHQVFSGLAQE